MSNCIFERLFGISSKTNVSDLHKKQQHDAAVECLSSLRYGTPKQNTFTFRVILKDKLWEQHIAVLEKKPIIDTLTQFLETRFRFMEMLEHRNESSKPKTLHTSIEQPICYMLVL